VELSFKSFFYLKVKIKDYEKKKEESADKFQTSFIKSQLNSNN